MNGSRELPERIVQSARRWIGTPYMHQASVRGAGCDCLGLVRGIWSEIYGNEPEAMPAYSPDWAEAGARESMLEAAQRNFEPCPDGKPLQGRLLLFRWRADALIKHAAIAVSATHMIHAHDGACVCEVAISPFWRRKLAAVFEFPALKN